MFPLISHPSWLQLLLFVVCCGHLTITAMSLYLHRSQTHQSVQFAPAVSHFFRFVLWFFSSTLTKVWVAIHRLHHSTTDKINDPHSPQWYGIWHIFFLGWNNYRLESKNIETIRSYGSGTPDDWIEKNVYTRYKYWGLLFFLPLLDCALFGYLGLLVWLGHVIWVPLWASGVVNGLGHYVGYRNYATKDESRNVSPIGLSFLTSGEVFHNNHHGDANNPKFSRRWFEFDIGWFYIDMLVLFGLAKLTKTKRKPLPA